MAFPTAVNDQITDSITQANTKVLGDAPAIAVGNLYQATAQALSNAAHNATNAQQQSNVIAQAALTQGVSTLLSIDTISTGKSPATAAKDLSDATKAMAAKNDAPLKADTTVATEAAKSEATAIETEAKKQGESLQANAEKEKDELNKKIQDAVNYALEINLGSATRFNHAVREVMDAYVSSMQAIAESQYQESLNTIKLAAISVTLRAMLDNPEQAGNYARTLDTIHNL